MWCGIRAEAVCGMSISAALFVLGWHHSKLRNWAGVCMQFTHQFTNDDELGCFVCCCLCKDVGLLNFLALEVGVWTNILQCLVKMGAMLLVLGAH
jgi:hypothetical protein